MVTAAWANTGEDKVTKDELRTVTKKRPVLSSCWDGATVRLRAAKNEVVSFNLVLENNTAAQMLGVSVAFDRLTGPGGRIIGSVPTDKAGLFDWTRRDVELFYVRYLPIKGLSLLSYGTYEEQHVPERLRSPTGKWATRPDRGKAYPDIAQPLETKPTFAIPIKKNQSIWCDVYVPRDAPAGTYRGTVAVRVAGALKKSVPVELAVRSFALPDVPHSKTMLCTSYHDVSERYAGVEYPNPDTAQDKLTKLVMDRQHLLAHRHKISLIGDHGADWWDEDRPRPHWEAKLDGSFFVPANGYRGPGEGVGSNVYSIFTYGEWMGHWGDVPVSELQRRAGNWDAWFEANVPEVERFLYLIDESDAYAQTEKWAGWFKGVVPTFATLEMPQATDQVPSLNKSGSWISVADRKKWEAALARRMATGRQSFMYNGQRPASGSFATEDDGVALRQLPWGQYKKGIDRWFFWEATYYKDYQGARGHNNVFANALTLGGTNLHADLVSGQTSWNYSNGDGVLLYPGIDKKYPGQSLGVQGPVASLRLKHWRRGIQDVDYVALAAKVDWAATQAIVDRMVPKVLWENDVADPADPSWQHCPISWSTDPDDWEEAREELASIIERGAAAGAKRKKRARAGRRAGRRSGSPRRR